MTKQQKKAYDKLYYAQNKIKKNRQCAEYYEKNKPKILDDVKSYAKKHKKKIKLYQSQYGQIHCGELKVYKREWKMSLRNEVIRLYSHGTMKCTCGAKVEQLHHTDMVSGEIERSMFGSGSNSNALKHHIEMYTLIPDYITPLCIKCHRKIHKEKHK